MLSRSKAEILFALLRGVLVLAAFAGGGAQAFAATQPVAGGAAVMAQAGTGQQAGQGEETAGQVLPAIAQSGNVYSFTLANGLQVIVLPNHRAPVVTNMIWYRAGSADEPRGHTGIAHFLEHLMFKGTEAYPAGEFSTLVARLGGEQNAFTSYDYTAYYEIIAPQYLKNMMMREADRMENLILTDDVIGPERQVIIEERRMRTDNDPASMLAEEARATLFLNSPYHNPVIGWKQEMEQLNRDDALAFYGKYYTPNNAVAIIAGDIEPAIVRALAMETYGKVKQRADTPERRRPQEPVSRSWREVTMRDGRVAEPSFQIYRLVPSYNNAKNKGEAEALDLLGEILGGGSQSRLYKNLVVKQGIAASVGSAYDGTAIDDGVFYLYGLPRGGATLADLQAAVEAEIAAIIKNGVSMQELEAARKRYMKDFVFSQDSPSGLAQLYGAALTTGMTIADVNNWPERLKSVKPADIKAVAAHYLAPGTGVISRLLPLHEAEKADNKQQQKAPGGKTASPPR